MCQILMITICKFIFTMRIDNLWYCKIEKLCKWRYYMGSKYVIQWRNCIEKDKNETRCFSCAPRMLKFMSVFSKLNYYLTFLLQYVTFLIIIVLFFLSKTCNRKWLLIMMMIRFCKVSIVLYQVFRMCNWC